MATFKGNFYRPKENIFFGDGRELELLKYVYERPDIDRIRGSPDRVLASIDEFAQTKRYLMNVGHDKGKKVVEVIEQVKPRVMVEMGGYVGYSTILFANAVQKAGGQYITLEREPEFAAVIMALVHLAGLRGVVRVEVGVCEKSLQRLVASGSLQQIDMAFLDHYKPAYTTDLKLCEELGLIRPGTVIAADNVITPGNAPYLEYVRSSVEDKHMAMQNQKNRENTASNFEPRTTKQYERQGRNDQQSSYAVGDPNLIYESRLIYGFEPSGEGDGVEITTCTGMVDNSI